MGKGASITVGQPLRIVVADSMVVPKATSTPVAAAASLTGNWTGVYVVKATDTLFDIAQAHGLSVRVDPQRS
jgi:LysM repeat protein